MWKTTHQNSAKRNIDMFYNKQLAKVKEHVGCCAKMSPLAHFDVINPYLTLEQTKPLNI